MHYSYWVGLETVQQKTFNCMFYKIICKKFWIILKQKYFFDIICNMNEIYFWNSTFRSSYTNKGICAVFLINMK
jgi:hypothetical protein